MSLWQTFFFAAVFLGGLHFYGTENWGGLTILVLVMSALAFASIFVERK